MIAERGLQAASSFKVQWRKKYQAGLDFVR